MAEQDKLDILANCFGKLEDSRKNDIRELTRKLVDIHANRKKKSRRKIAKKNIPNVLFIIPITIMFAMALGFISCASSDSSNDTRGLTSGLGESSPLVSGTQWEYSEDSPNYPVYYIMLDHDGNAIWYDSSRNIVHHLTNESTWERVGNTVRIHHNAGYRSIEGTLADNTSPRKITGGGINRQRIEWQFTMVEH